ncbi:50S ribosomal protein L15 [Candidatus Woesearchaeota archaeon]|jgi:large subunit ribosomal protein L15|nr:50S ribosomal protein L15 [Candidatus Woesearchaeota archaeon]
MVTTKNKKVTKYRAHTTHGGGHRKKRRGAGNRGGRGMAGSGKRACQKKQKHRKSFGGKGFHSHCPRTIKSIHLGDLTKLIIKTSDSEAIQKKGDIYQVDLLKLGYQKLIGTGSTSLKLEVNVSAFTKKAEEKIAAAGGKIVYSKNEAVKVKTESSPDQEKSEE